MNAENAVWSITLVGEADQTFERLLNELSGYVVQAESLDGTRLDAVLIDAHTCHPVDEEGNPTGERLEIERLLGVHVY